jgi:hypothetical protein
METLDFNDIPVAEPISQAYPAAGRKPLASG